MTGPDSHDSHGGGRLPIATGRESAVHAWGLVRRPRKRAGLLAACIAAFVLDAAAGLVGPLALGRIVDVAERGGTVGDLRGPVTALVAAAVVVLVTTTAAVALLAAVAEPALARLREQVLDRALHLDVVEVERGGAGDLMSRVGDDVRLVAGSITQVVPLFLGSALSILLTSAGLFALDWRLGLAGLIALPFYGLGLRWYLPRSGPMYREERQVNGERAEAFLTGVHASRTLRALGLSDRHQERVREASWRSAQISIRVFHMLTRYFARNNRAEAIGLVSILAAGHVLVRAEAVTVGEVTAAALLFHRLFNPIGAVMGLFDEVQSAGASLTRLVGVARLPPVVDHDDARAPEGALRLRGVGHEYLPGRPVVCGVDLTVAPGERVAVVGGSGAGKSTLATLVAGREPARGTVRLGDRPLRPGRDVVLVAQEVHVFSGSVRENLTLARPGAHDDTVWGALADVGADRWVAALPDGLDTVVGEGAHPLTTAAAQHLALARVLLADPPVVVLDEATAEAGSAGARDLDDAAAAVVRGRVALTIAHRLTQAVEADRVLVMADGRVVEQGSHADLVAADGVYARLWAAWSEA